MRTAKAAIAYSVAHSTIPYNFTNNIGQPATVDDLECARSVMNDYGIIPVTWASFPTATSIWRQATTKHEDDYNFPDGALICFPNYGAGKSGHIGLGYRGKVFTTPIWLEGGSPYGYKELLTVAEVEAKCGNAYAGWAGDFAGHLIDFTSTSSGGTSKPFPEDESEPDMPILYYNGNDTDAGKRYFWSEAYGHVFGAKDYPNIINQALPLGKQTGAVNLQTDAAFDKFVKEHRQGYTAAIGDVTVNATSDPKVLAALEANAAAIKAMPAAIATALLDLEAKRLAS